MTIADHSAPFATDADRKCYQLMVCGETFAHLVDQEAPIVVHRWEDEYTFLVRLLDELPNVLIYRPHELVVGHAEVPVYDWIIQLDVRLVWSAPRSDTVTGYPTVRFSRRIFDTRSG